MEENIMSEQLRKYVEQWNELANGQDSWRRDKELFDLQGSIRFMYEKEKDFLTSQEKEKVNKILDYDVERFL